MSDFSSILPNNNKVLERDEKWKQLFEKYENCGDCEEDGYDVRDLIACGEVEDEELDDLLINEAEAIESSDESDKINDNNRDLIVFTSKSKTLQDLERIYDPEFIKGLKRAFNKRCTELDGMNLTFWKRSKTQEGFNESNIKTPNFEASSRSFFRSSEQVCQSPNQFKMPHPINFNRDNFQFGNCLQNMDQTSNFETSQRFPIQINDLMNGSQKINIRIREMHYDLSVDGRDITELFIPNCNSTYKNAIPALGNLTINNTISNFNNLQKTEAIRPAIKYDVDQIRTAPTEKVIEKPELNLSIAESLNSSVIDNLEGINISDSSREGCSLKGRKNNKRNGHKKKSKKRNHKSKRKNVKPESEIKVITSNIIAPISEKLELSYSDVVKLSPKNNLKQTKTLKPVNDSRKQIDQQKNKKVSQEKINNYRRIVDPDTSTEDLFEKQEKVKKTESSTKIPENNNNNNTVKYSTKLKDKPEVSNKTGVSGKNQTKSYKSNEVKKTVEIVKSEMPSNNHDQLVKREKQKVQQKPKDSVKSNENRMEQSKEKSSKNKSETTKKPSSDKKENESELQYDGNGFPFRNIGGFVVRYEENSDSDSSEDDTEFFRRVHAEIRQRKVLNNKCENSKVKKI